MGNQSSIPRYQYPYQAPTDYSWASYVSQCSLRHSKQLQETFNAGYKNKVVSWMGYVVSVTDTHVKFCMNPADCRFTNNDLTLKLDKHKQAGKLRFFPNQPSSFVGKLMTYGSLKNHQVQELPAESRELPDPHFTYEDFLFLFGSAAQDLPSYYFEHYWKEREVDITGRFTQTPPERDPNANPPRTECTVPFLVVSGNVKDVESVSVRLLYAQTQLVAQVVHAHKTDRLVTIRAKLMSRMMVHTVSLISVGSPTHETSPQSARSSHISASAPPAHIDPVRIPPPPQRPQPQPQHPPPAAPVYYPPQAPPQMPPINDTQLYYPQDSSFVPSPSQSYPQYQSPALYGHTNPQEDSGHSTYQQFSQIPASAYLPPDDIPHTLPTPQSSAVPSAPPEQFDQSIYSEFDRIDPSTDLKSEGGSTGVRESFM
ncbi:hypothetical protein BLNAU_21907 [Blattamonas nauphoetae]|uniref:Uncharacterized protein n=1 Tax=Blattamonas nauphoetae TaxID=2049346 RepID=A0ABQ9WVN3_9EUKA|nr:hypothetical protein BLNAU_21907 [Blattamonas nauphoetae]